MIHWMDQNYSRILDLFRRFDSDNSGTISYDEFAAGMKDLGELVITIFFLAFFFLSLLQISGLMQTNACLFEMILNNGLSVH